MRFTKPFTYALDLEIKHTEVYTIDANVKKEKKILSQIHLHYLIFYGSLRLTITVWQDGAKFVTSNRNKQIGTSTFQFYKFTEYPQSKLLFRLRSTFVMRFRPDDQTGSI